MSDQDLRFRRTLANFGRPLSDDRQLFAALYLVLIVLNFNNKLLQSVFYTVINNNYDGSQGTLKNRNKQNGLKSTSHK